MKPLIITFIAALALSSLSCSSTRAPNKFQRAMMSVVGKKPAVMALTSVSNSIPMTLDIALTSPNVVKLTIHCDPSINPCVQWTTNLADRVWTTIQGTNGCFKTTNGFSFITETPMFNQRFFRLKYP